MYIYYIGRCIIYLYGLVCMHISVYDLGTLPKNCPDVRYDESWCLGWNFPHFDSPVTTLSTQWLDENSGVPKTHLATNVAPARLRHPKKRFIFQPSIFRCYVSFREGTFSFRMAFFLSLRQCLFESWLEVRIHTPIKTSGLTKCCWIHWEGIDHLFWKPKLKSLRWPGQTSKTIAVSKWKAFKPGLDSDKACMTWLLLQLICFSRSWQAA